MGRMYSQEQLDKVVLEARISENQMGLQWHKAVKNGLEQQSENAQLTATWKANEQIISEFETRIKELQFLDGKTLNPTLEQGEQL